MSSIKATSRRRLLKGLGLAAASLAAASATTLTTPKESQAASGDIILAGTPNLTSDTTYLSQTNNTTALNTANSWPNAVMWVDYNSSGQSSVVTRVNAAFAGTSATTDSSGIGGYFQGDRAPLLLAPATSAGAPSTGTHSAGEFYVDSQGNIYYYNGMNWSQLNAVSSGTWANRPSSPSALTRYYATDRRMEYTYFTTDSQNNTLNKWLSSQVFSETLAPRSTQPFNNGGTASSIYFDTNLSKYNLGGGIFVETLNSSFYNFAAQGSSNYYTYELYLTNSGIGATWSQDHPTAQAGTNNTQAANLATSFLNVDLTYNRAVNQNYMLATLILNPTGSPGGFYASAVER